MTLPNILILIVYAFGLSLGQVLFKISADRAKGDPSNSFLLSLLSNGYFFLALVIYGGLTLVWVWILTRVPLSRAYPFVVLAFVFTPVLAALVFGEALNLWYFTGLSLILFGLGVLVWKAG